MPKKRQFQKLGINPTLRAVLFDLDGVLIDSINSHIRAWQQVFSDYGVSLDALEIRLREGEKAEVSLDYYCMKYHLDLTVEQKLDLIDRKRAIFAPLSPKALIPEASTLLGKLKNQGWKIALVTGSAAENLKQIMTREEYACFDVFVTSADYQRPKPHPQCYAMALEKLGLTPKNCMVVENAPFGIAAAKAAGLKVIAITSTLPEEYLKAADWIVNDFGGVERLLF